MSKVLFIFLDGVGIGKKDYDFNPFFKHNFRTFTDIFNDIPSIGNEFLEKDDKYIFPTDTILGIEGLPQSGTGQTSIFCGINAQKLIGKHFGPFPYSSLYPIIENKNLLKQIKQKGKKVAFANAFPQIYFDYLNSGKKRLSVPTLCCLSTDIHLKTFDDLKAGNALSAEIDNHRWVNRLYYDLPIITAEEAANRLLDITNNNDFTLFEYFYSDYLGHGRLSENFEQILNALDNFLFHILTNYNNETTIIICTDHGNLEDLSVKTHTLNFGLTLVAGYKSILAKNNITNITEIKNFVLNELC